MKYRLNDDNLMCRRCGGETRPLFHSGKMRYCPKCEKDEEKEVKKENLDNGEISDFFIDFDPIITKGDDNDIS